MAVKKVVAVHKVFGDGRVVIPAQVRKELGLVVRADRPVGRAYFHYRFRVYNRALARKIKTLLGELPDSIEQLEAVEKEESRPKAAGPEAYAPEHDYVYSGHGELETVRGVEELITLRRRLAERNWIEVSKIRLEVR